MTLSTGSKLSHYEISSLLGKGGMGEVYQAKDQKLGRDVAIKILPEEFARDADRVARFQREAKLLASLNHPNIASIYGLEESDGAHFLVLELVEGDTLSDRIKAGPIPVEESLKLALQIAEALEAAHERGVIHRDLKPSNIKVTPDGKIKVLDFGLAKAFAGDQEEMILSDSPTLSVAATQRGVILGTAAYMSPEQAKGKSIDKRTDIWAFGCVLYEMLTGRSMFAAEDVSQTLARVLEREPDFSLLPQNLHPKIIEMLERCLEKDARNRYGSISDARVDIKKVLADPRGVLVQRITGVEPRRKLRNTLLWIAAIILAAIIAGVAVWKLKPTELNQVMRFDYYLPEGQEFTNPGRSLLAVSPDGTKIVYTANRQIYQRNVNELTAKPIEGTAEIQGSLTPFISPDGQWVGYYSTTDGQLKKISVSGGAPVKLCNASAPPYGVTWGTDDRIFFGTSAGIMSVSASGGTAKLLIEIKEDEQVHGPQALPRGEWVLFTIAKPSKTIRWDEAQIVVQSLETDERKVLVSGGSDARYVPTGHLVYALGNVLFAVAFDIDSMEVIGGAIPIVEGIQRSRGRVTGTANYGFSDAGMLAYVVRTTSSQGREKLVWVNLEGKEEAIAAPLNNYNVPQISPDGIRIAFDVDSGENIDIWIWDLVRETMTRLTTNESVDGVPLWTPDGERIVFTSLRDGNFGIYWKAADGTGQVEPLLGGVPDRRIFPAAFSGDGKIILLSEAGSASSFDIGILSMEAEPEHELLLHENHGETQPRISPDGQWIAYMSDESGQYEVYVRPFPDVNKRKLQVSTSGGTEPKWSRDGKKLFYRSGEAIMAVSVKTEPTFQLEAPEILFRIVLAYAEDLHTSWDVSPDGKRFLMIKEATDVAVTEAGISRPRINIVLNWLEELKERVPVD